MTMGLVWLVVAHMYTKRKALPNVATMKMETISESTTNGGVEMRTVADDRPSDEGVRKDEQV